MILICLLPAACGPENEAGRGEQIVVNEDQAARPEFPLPRFAGSSKRIKGEASLPLAEGEIDRLRGAVGLLEEVLPESDPRRPILWSTRIRFVEDQGHQKAAGRWDAEGGYIEIGRRTFEIDCLQLVVTLGHEFTHAVHEQATPRDLNELLQSEVRAYESELSVVRRLLRLVRGMDDLDTDARRYFELALDRHDVAAMTMLRSYQLRLDLVGFATTVGLFHDQMKAAGVDSRKTDFLHSCEMGLAAICLAQRPMTSSDGQSADRILSEFASFLEYAPRLRIDDGVGIHRIIGKLRQKVDEVGQGFRLLARKEALVDEQARAWAARLAR